MPEVDGGVELPTSIHEGRPRGASPRYRIAFIGGRGVVGRYSGIETFYEEVGSRLAARGHEVTAYCRQYFTPACESYRGIRVRRFPAPRTKHLETLIHSCWASIDATARGFDIVHIHAIGSSVFAFLPRVTGCRTVVTVHGVDWRRPKWKGIARKCLQAAEWASLRFPNRTTAVSQAVADDLEARYGVQVEAIPNGVNMHPPVSAEHLTSLGLTPGRYILFVGRLAQEKGCQELVEAFARLGAGGFQLAIAGGASYSSEYENKLRLGKGANVKFLDWVDHDILAELYSNCALFVLPSTIEGLSVALLEAMSYGAAVLVSDIPENLEAMGGAGYSFRSADVDDLTTQLSRILPDPVSRGVKGLEARRRVQELYAWEHTVSGFERIYDSMFTSKRRAK